MPAAEEALEQANGDLKLGVLIAMGETPQEGAAMLEASGGNLRSAIGRLFGAGDSA